MKRIFILLAIALVGTVAFADQELLIDFSLLEADTTVSPNATAPDQHEATLVDFAEVAGASIDPQMRELMKSSLYIGNWEVDLNSSAQSALSQSNSKVAQARVRAGATNFPDDAVLGVRIHFPTEPWNAWAVVRPPFEIQAYEDAPDGTRGAKFENGFGVLKNVGVIKQIGVWVYGLNYPHSLSVILQDENNEQEEIFMGYLDFDGWRQLIWDNPNYIVDVRDRELRSYPLYPNLQPMRKLIGFRIYRDGSTVGGDFITYIHDVELVYDRALLELESDIDHDALWMILEERESDRRRAELRRLGNEQVLRFIEQELQATEDLNSQQQ